MGLKDSRSKEFFSGMGSAVASITIMYPVTKCIYRQILENSLLLDSMLRMKKEGIRFLYRGVGPPMLQRCTELSLMFGVYRSAEVALKPLHLAHYQERLACAAIAGAVEAVFTPFERIQMLLMDSKNHSRFRNMAHCVYVLGTEYGPKEFFRGVRIILIRNVCHNMFFFTTKEMLYERLAGQNVVRKNIENFMVGSIVGLSMTTLFYPIKVVKVHIQRELGGEFPAISKITKNVYSHKNRGIRNFYRGLGLNIVRAMVGWGITNFAYEFIRTRI